MHVCIFYHSFTLLATTQTLNCLVFPLGTAGAEVHSPYSIHISFGSFHSLFRYLKSRHDFLQSKYKLAHKTQQVVGNAHTLSPPHNSCSYLSFILRLSNGEHAKPATTTYFSHSYNHVGTTMSVRHTKIQHQD